MVYNKKVCPICINHDYYILDYCEIPVGARKTQWKLVIVDEQVYRRNIFLKTKGQLNMNVYM